MTTYEKIVKGATKVKVAAPKEKYIEPILMATQVENDGGENFETIMRNLQIRLQNSSWSVVYKLLIVLHIMIREGERDVTLNYLADHPGMLNLNNNITKNGHNSEVKNIMKYAKYLQARVKQFDMTGTDYVRDERSNNITFKNGGKLRYLGIEKGLLRESESVQKQIDALLKNNFTENEVSNDVVLTAFRLLVNDLLALFQELNEGVINILEHYFEISRVDAERALKVYRKFVDQTKYVIDYLRVAKHLEYATKLYVPTIKHAPIALTSSLEEYLFDPNFENNRRQYLAENNKNLTPLQRAESEKKIYSGSAQDREDENNANHSKIPPSYSAATRSAAGQQNLGLSEQKDLANRSVSQYSNPWSYDVTQQQQQLQQLLQQAQSSGGQIQLPMQVAAISQASDPSGIWAYQQGGMQQVPVGDLLLQSFTGQEFQQHNSLPFINANLPQQNTMGQGYQQPNVQQFVTTNSLQHVPTGQNFGGTGSPFQHQGTGNPFMQQNTYNNYSSVSQPAEMMSQQTQTNLKRQSTNPFASMTGSFSGQSPPRHQSATNPFLNTRFSSGTNVTPLSTNNGSSAPLAASSTGGNPFAVSPATSNLFDQVQNQSSQLKPQPTAGGLENLRTDAVFPETQEQAQKQYFQDNAQANLQRQMTQAYGPTQQWGNAPNGTFQNNLQPQSAFVYEGPSLI